MTEFWQAFDTTIITILIVAGVMVAYFAYQNWKRK